MVMAAQEVTDFDCRILVGDRHISHFLSENVPELNTPWSTMSQKFAKRTWFQALLQNNG